MGKRVTVLGLGVEGVDLVRFLASHGAAVTVSDARDPKALSARIEELNGLSVQYSLGANRIEDATSADLLFVSQGVPATLPAIEAARGRGVPVSSMAKLFFELCPGPTIGITGSSGKTTTTALVGAMFDACGRKHVVGGNIGVGLLGLLDSMNEERWAVLELSHTQLEGLERSPQIACVLNVTPNHLDRFTWEEYCALKLRILQYQSKEDIAVLNLDDEVACSFMTEAPGQMVWFSARREPTGDAAFIRDGAVTWRKGPVETKLFGVGEIPLRGGHNVSNVLAAVAVGCAAGLEFDGVARAVREFAAVPHRIELVSEIDGVAYFNDSIATTPERTIAGLRAFEEPVVLLLGGRGKNLPFDELAAEAVNRCRAVVCFGEAGRELEAAIGAAAAVLEREVPVERVATVGEAVYASTRRAHPGDVVLLSPACTSYDAYDNFEQRGEDFRQAVGRLAGKAKV